MPKTTEIKPEPSSKPWMHREKLEADWRFLKGFYRDRIQNRQPVAEIISYFTNALALIEAEREDGYAYRSWYHAKISKLILNKSYGRAFNVLTDIIANIEGHKGGLPEIDIKFPVSTGMHSIINRICKESVLKKQAKWRIFILVGFITVFKYHTEIRDLLKHLCDKEQIPFLEFLSDVKEIAKEEPEFL